MRRKRRPVPPEISETELLLIDREIKRQVRELCEPYQDMREDIWVEVIEHEPSSPLACTMRWYFREELIGVIEVGI